MPKKFKIDPGGAKPLPFTLVERELEEVEISLRQQVRHFDPGVEPYISYICDTAGKRIRPTLSILVDFEDGVLKLDAQ